MPRNDLKRPTKITGCERCGPRPVKSSVDVKLLRARAVDPNEPLKPEQRRWDALHCPDGQPKKLHEVLAHPDVIRAHIDELAKDTHELLADYHSRREPAGQKRAEIRPALLTSVACHR